LHEALTRLHVLEGRYTKLEAEHEECGKLELARERDRQLAGHLGQGSLADAVRELSKSERVQILEVIAEGEYHLSWTGRS
jgi:hypothetical protein